RTSRSQNPPGVGNAATAAIGPGSYNTAIGGGSSSKPPKPSFAAFGSSGLKDAYPDLPLHTPGPGAYVTTSPAAYSVPRGEPVSSMFKSSTERTKFKSASAAPGPGAYAAAHPSAFKKSKAASAAKAAASSMYDRKITGCANDVSGPGEYDPLTAIHRLACTRATSFAKSKTSRDQKPKAASAPGPGFYHPEDHDHHAAVPSAVFKSTLTRERATNPMTRSTASSAVPGPGSYNAAATPLGQNAKKPEHLQFFGSTTSRFDAVKKWGSSSPCGAPVKSSAFASATSRFQNPATKDAVPCPGDYEAVFASHLDRGSALDKKSAAMPEPRFKSKLAPLANLVRRSPCSSRVVTHKLLLVQGPGAYNPDTIETDWNRPTYNITIATEMEKRI
ncbi:hypothetical protein DYB30_011332, partial [Aphanomyces astaci]